MSRVQRTDDDLVQCLFEEQDSEAGVDPTGTAGREHSYR